MEQGDKKPTRPFGRRPRPIGRSGRALGLGAIFFTLALLGAPESVPAYDPGRVSIHRPLAGWDIQVDYHDYSEGESRLTSGDVNRYDWDDAYADVYAWLSGFPPYSLVAFYGYVDNSTPCSGLGTNGDRYVLHVWVTPPGRPERYIGYVVYQHLINARDNQTWWAWADERGSVAEIVGNVGAGYTVDRSCWTAPHVHMFASRSSVWEWAYGSYTTGAGQTWQRMATYASELYFFSVDWDR